jgi:hypothetical protein
MRTAFLAAVVVGVFLGLLPVQARAHGPRAVAAYYYAPAPVCPAPVSTYYAPAVTYYQPVTTYVPVTTYTSVTTYYAPAPVVVPAPPPAVVVRERIVYRR